VTARAGGEAAKFGETYEGQWTVSRLLDVLAGRALSIFVEDEEALAEGAEFTFRRGAEVTEVHQVKRAVGTAGTWSLSSLRNEGVLSAMALHADAGRRFCFVSTTPTPWLHLLADRARRSDDLDAFRRVQLTSKEARSNFVKLEGGDVWGSSEDAWRILRHVTIDWTSESQLRATNTALAAVYVQGGEPPLLVAGLADLVSRNTGVRLDAAAIYERLSEHGLARTVLADEPALAAAVAATRGRWVRTVEPELLQPEIPRSEAAEIADRLAGDGERVVLVAGAAGSGKSGVMLQVESWASAQGWPTLAFRLDRLEPFTTSAQLAEQLDLKVSPVTALGVVAGDEPSLLVIDQLDAVSFASGRLPRQLEPIVELVEQAEAFPLMRVVLACRQYDLDNDPRLGALVSDHGPAVRHALGALSNEQIDEVVRSRGLDPAQLTSEQRQLLASPLHLVLLSAVADQDNALQFRTNMDLMREFYTRKERDCRSRANGATVRFASVVGGMAAAMSARQRLSVPRSLLDEDDLGPSVDIMASEHVVVLDGQRAAFFHEAFFDYVFARRWVAGEQSLIDWLCEGEQELFRRAQVRQILAHLRDLDPDRFVDEISQCLASELIRVHIKDVILSLLATLPDPTHEEWELLAEIREKSGWMGERTWRALRTSGWFARADAEGALEAWLRSDEAERRARALEIMAAGSIDYTDRVADLLGLLEAREQYGHALVWTTIRADLGSSRVLVDRMLDAVRRGDLNAYGHDLFMATHDMKDSDAGWMSELVEAWLAGRPDGLKVAHGQVEELQSRDYGLIRAIKGASTGAPATFARLMIPYMLRVMELCAHASDRQPISDYQFLDRAGDDDDRDAGEALLHGVAHALRTVGTSAPEDLDELIAPLLAAPYETAQWLAYQGLTGAGARRANSAADILLEGPGRLEATFGMDSYWGTRELLIAIGPTVDDGRFVRLEKEVLALRDEDLPHPDYASFILVSALPESRLSAEAATRLSEMRNRFGRDQPGSPEPRVSSWTVRSPVEQDLAESYSDDEWLAAMRKYASEREQFGGEIGGARELARVLDEVAKRDPARFAGLALLLDESFHPEYLSSILQALAAPTESLPAEAAFAVIRHAAQLGIAKQARWVGWPLHSILDAEIPSDIIDLIVDLALEAVDPGPSILSTTRRSPETAGRALVHSGLNSARGSATRLLTQLVAADVDGRRAARVAPALSRLAADPDLGVRAMVAELLAVSLQHARPAVMSALPHLLDAHDELLAERTVQNLLLHAGDRDPDVVLPVIDRMLRSALPAVREAGGRQAAFAALEWDRPEHLAGARAGDPSARRGVATVCARRLPFAGNPVLASTTLLELFDDPDPTVRDGAAEVAAALRDYALQPHREVLLALIGSPALKNALPQLAITYEQAPDDIGEFLGPTVTRLMEIAGDEVASIANGAAADARHFGELVIRWYGQAKDGPSRRRALDLVDAMLTTESYGVADLVGNAER
jgi:hypothetical protein